MVSCGSFPAIFIDSTTTKNVIVLLSMPGRSSGIVKRINKRNALQCVLLNTVNGFRSLNANKLQNSRQNISYMPILCTYCALIFYAFRIKNNQRVVCAAFTVGILLPVFEWSIASLCPA